jgi:chromate transporter
VLGADARDEEPAVTSAPASTTTRLREIAWVFAKIGTTAFGGPAAHIAMMEDEVVRRRAWIDRAAFLDLVGATNLIPGPNSTELAIHLGRLRAGWLGLLVAGACFIMPAATIVSAIAWLYVQYGELPRFAGVLWGIKPVIIAVVVQALVGLGKTAVKSTALALVGLAALVASLVGVHELVVLAAAGVLVGCWWRVRLRPDPPAAAMVALPLVGVVAPAGAASFGLAPLFLVFLKIGSVLFGSGYVLLAFLRADLVDRLGWLTEAQLIDAVAVGQFTPGPVFTTATFVGWVLGGPAAAAVATAGIFLPAFVFVALSGPLVPRLRRSPTAGAILDGINVASLALMAAVAWTLGRAAIIDVPTAVIAGVAALLLLRWRVNSAWLVLGGAVVGAIAGR